MTQQSKPSYNQRDHINGIKGIPRRSSSGDQGDCTTESYRCLDTEGHTTKSQKNNLRSRNKQKKESPKMGRQRNNPQQKGKEKSQERVLNEIEAANSQTLS